MDALGEAEEGNHGEGDSAVVLGVLLQQGSLEGLLEGASHWMEQGVLLLEMR